MEQFWDFIPYVEVKESVWGHMGVMGPLTVFLIVFSGGQWSAMSPERAYRSQKNRCSEAADNTGITRKRRVMAAQCGYTSACSLHHVSRSHSGHCVFVVLGGICRKNFWLHPFLYHLVCWPCEIGPWPGRLSSFSAITLLVGSSDSCKIVSEMTYKVPSGTLNPTIPYH